MRVTPPKSLKLDRTELLEDIRERLIEKDPALAEKLDRGHPAWLILQEAAWLVESLSEQLDDYPWAVVQQLAHLFGAEIGPAQPALGVVVAQASESGVLDQRMNPAKWRLLAPQTEHHGLIEFGLVEPAAPVVPVKSWTAGRLRAAELEDIAIQGGPCHAWLGEATRSEAFDHEQIRFEVVASDPEAVLKHLKDAIERLPKERAVDWLVLDASQDGERVFLDARIDPAAALGEDGAVADGGEVSFRWGALDDSTWAPPIRVSDDPRLARWIRASQPRPGDEADQRVVDGVPSGFPLAELLVREARPVPPEVVGSIWKTLSHLNTRLGPLRPTTYRSLGDEEGLPGWVEAAMRKETWFTLADRADIHLVHVELDGPASARVMRLAWVGPRPAERVRAFGIHAEAGMIEKPLALRESWRMELPAHQGGSTHWVVVFEIEVPAEVSGVVSTCDGSPVGAMVNPLMVVDAPMVRDGRAVGIRRAVPESASLLHQDVVSREVIQQVVDQGLHPSAAEVLLAMPLARFTVEGDDPIDDFEGVQVDPVDGELLFNAPDAFGIGRQLRRGSTVRLGWYRRTHASAGNVGADQIKLVEQAPSTRPRLTSPTNPLPLSRGAERESEESAILRMFGPSRGVPVTAADWEREILRALGSRARGWLIRVWGYAERTTVHTAVWPWGGVDDRKLAQQVRSEIAASGPEVLLVVLGPRDQVIAPEDLAWARGVIDRVVRDASRRVPTIERAVVSALWPLTLRGGDPSMPMPAFHARSLQGTLVDPTGRSAAPPSASLLLNAAVVAVETDA